MEFFARLETLSLLCEWDRRFALTRCWSGGDSNRRSSLWFLALSKGSKFKPGHCG